MPDRLRRARRGEVMLQLTASDLVSLAVNAVQNGWAYNELSLESAGRPRNSATLPADVRADWPHEILVQVYTATLMANRGAAALSCWEEGAQ